VYVNGLPAWSSELDYLTPPTFDPHFAGDALKPEWDEAVASERTTLFLGTLPPGQTFDITLLLRVDMKVDAPDCPEDRESFPSNQVTIRCYSQKETLSIPSRFISRGNAPFGFRGLDFSVHTVRPQAVSPRPPVR
jgi:hypothetical protein